MTTGHEILNEVGNERNPVGAIRIKSLTEISARRVWRKEEVFGDLPIRCSSYLVLETFSLASLTAKSVCQVKFPWGSI